MLFSGVRFNPSLLGFALLFACDQTPEPPHHPDPEPAPVLTLDCVSFRSTVVFEAVPDSAQSLEATYQGAKFAHWWFGASDDPDGGRRLRYRSGTTIYAIEPGSTASLEYVDIEREASLLQFELRRALMLWPDGFAWRETERGREFEIQDGSGRLMVELEEGEPIRFYSRNSEGLELESFSELTWQEFRGRTFPENATLSVRGTAVWTETLTEIRPDCEFASFFFLPPDRRPSADPSNGQTGTLRHLDLPERLVKRIPLTAGLHWNEVQELGAAALKKATNQLPGLARQLSLAIELDQAAQPSALLLLLDLPGDVPREGVLSNWPQEEPGPALSVLLSGYGELSSGKLLGLQRFLPEGAEAGTPYLRLPAEQQPGLPLQLVLRIRAN